MIKSVYSEENNKLVSIENISPAKTYIIKVNKNFYTLKKCNPVGPTGKKWVWLNIFCPDSYLDIIETDFVKAVKNVLIYGTVYELGALDDLIDYLIKQGV